MKTSEALKQIMKSRDIGTNTLASRLGKKANVISERLGQDNISIQKLNEMLRVLDYKVVLIPRNARTPEGGYEVE